MANPFAIDFEENLPGFVIPGTATATVTEVGGTTPIYCIKTSQAWGVNVTWQTGGALTPFMAGDFHVTVYLEKMGSGESADLPSLSVPLVAVDPHTYNASLSFAAGVVPDGAYKVAVTVTMHGPAPGFVPGPVAGVGDGPLLQFYTA
jgi:hypothetical protein